MTLPANPITPRDLLVLAALARRPLHGYGIIKAVETGSETGTLLDPGNLYRTLRRMRREGWVEDLEDDTAEPSDDRRRVYRLTREGRRMLRSEVERMEALVSRIRPALRGDA